MVVSTFAVFVESERFLSAFAREDTHRSCTTFNFLGHGVPARVIFHEINIARSARAGKMAAIENGLKAGRHTFDVPNLMQNELKQTTYRSLYNIRFST